jgi:hypothetical protein
MISVQTDNVKTDIQTDQKLTALPWDQQSDKEKSRQTSKFTQIDKYLSGRLPMY